MRFVQSIETLVLIITNILIWKIRLKTLQETDVNAWFAIVVMHQDTIREINPTNIEASIAEKTYPVSQKEIEMKKNKGKTILFSSLALIALILVAAFGPQVASIAAAFGNNAPSPAASVKLTELSADEISAYRWEAIAQAYSGDPYAGVDLTTLNAQDVTAFRWLAKARVYEKLYMIDK
jgi:EamA domain-containing membrane protein RarD